jgi:hypothetical protein
LILLKIIVDINRKNKPELAIESLFSESKVALIFFVVLKNDEKKLPL